MILPNYQLTAYGGLVSILTLTGYDYGQQHSEKANLIKDYNCEWFKHRTASIVLWTPGIGLISAIIIRVISAITNHFCKENKIEEFQSPIINTPTSITENVMKENRAVSNWKRLKLHVKNFLPRKGEVGLCEEYIVERFAIKMTGKISPVHLYIYTIMDKSDLIACSAKTYFKQWQVKHSHQVSFVDYMEKTILSTIAPEHLEQDPRTVRVLSDVERESRLATFSQGTILLNNASLRNGKYIFALTRTNALYVSLKKGSQLGVIQHSSLSNGTSVRSAGYFVINNNRIDTVEVESGHYKPSKDQALSILTFLKIKKIDLSLINLKFRASDPYPYNAFKWIQSQ